MPTRKHLRLARFSFDILVVTILVVVIVMIKSIVDRVDFIQTEQASRTKRVYDSKLLEMRIKDIEDEVFGESKQIK